MLWDCPNYPPEVKIRNFRNEYADQSFVFGVFDSCRTIISTVEADLVKGAKKVEKEDIKKVNSNLILIFCSEPTRPVLVNDKVTAALFKYISK